MKWYYYILFFLAFACKNSVTVTEDAIGADIFYVKDSYKPFTGKCNVVYNNTNIIKEQFTFKKGVLHGESIAWYKDGKLRRKGFYCKGQISGKWEFWDKQGKKIIEAHYKEDILNGTYLARYANGKIKEKGKFAANRQTGKWVYYNENGQLIR